MREGWVNWGGYEVRSNANVSLALTLLPPSRTPSPPGFTLNNQNRALTEPLQHMTYSERKRTISGIEIIDSDDLVNILKFILKHYIINHSFKRCMEW